MAPLPSIHTPEQRAHYRTTGAWSSTTLADQVRAHAAEAPRRVAVIDGTDGRKITYGQLLDDASRLATFLQEQGVGPGSGVSVQLPNRYETVVVDLAVLLLGARLNPLLPNYRRKELAHILQASSAACYVTPATYRGFDHLELADVLLDGLSPTPGHLVVDEGATGRTTLAGALERPPLVDLPELDASAVSEVVFTSGTEALPKAVMHSEETANHSVRAAYLHLGMTPADVVWMPSPIGHSTGLNFGVRMALLHGLPLVLQDRWDPAEAVDLVEHHRATYTLAATTFLADLLRAGQGRDLSSLVRFGCGGAPVPAELVRAASDAGIEVLRIYGSTEALIVSWCQPGSPIDKRMHTDGLPPASTEVEVRDEDGRACSSGTVGELAVRGPNVCLGFLHDPVRTSETFDAQGWLRSGDLGTIDDAGYVSIVGRKKEIIIRGGLNITPREIEDLLAEMPGVADVAVIGVPDARLGEIVCACVVPEPGASIDLEKALAFLRERELATYKLPQRLEVVEVLPRTPTGKVRKTELATVVAGGTTSP